MTVAWDTTLASRLYPSGRLERHLLERAHAGMPVALAAPTVMEVVRGLQAAAVDKPRFPSTLAWFIQLAKSDLVEILPLDAPAAIVAGRLRATHPTPPTGTRRAGVKAEQRTGWVLDIQIASCTWTHGHGIATENLRDFEAIRDLIARLYPGTSPLDVWSDSTVE